MTGLSEIETRRKHLANTRFQRLSHLSKSSLPFFFSFSLFTCVLLLAKFKYRHGPFVHRVRLPCPLPDIVHHDRWATPSPYRKPISLISHSDVRYRGILAGIDPAASTIQLSNGMNRIYS